MDSPGSSPPEKWAASCNENIPRDLQNLLSADRPHVWPGEDSIKPVRIEEVELWRLEIPMEEAVSAAHGSFHSRSLVLVRVVGGDGEGWGECAALGEPSYSEEFADGAYLVLETHLAPRLLAAGPVEPSDIGPVLAGIKGNRMAKASLEMAVLDLSLNLAGRSLASYLGATRKEVAAGAVIGIPSGSGERERLKALRKSAKAALATGSKRLKVKICPGWDLAPLLELRRSYPDLVLLADANGSYSRYGIEGEEAARKAATSLRRLEGLELVAIEQPLSEDDLRGHRALAAMTAVPLGLDESLSSLSRLEDVLEQGGCAVVCIKPSRLGGYLNGACAVLRCRQSGVSTYIGGMYDSALARSANAALAGLDGVDLPSDLAGGERYFGSSLWPGHKVSRGQIVVGTAPGIGTRPPPTLLESCTVRRTRCLRQLYPSDPQPC